MAGVVVVVEKGNRRSPTSVVDGFTKFLASEFSLSEYRDLILSTSGPLIIIISFSVM